MADLASVKLTVRGRVQGVYFRDFTRRHATCLGIAGYVRNLPDGSVEVTAQGERHSLEALLCHLKVGPPGARVQSIETCWSEPSGDYAGFAIQY